MAAQQMERLEAETTIPSLRGSALFGNFLGYRRDPIAFYMGLGWSGDISSYRMLTAPVVFINEPRLIQSLLVERAADYDKGKLQRYLFRPDAERALPRYAYLPFGAGHRVCIGSHFATMEGHLLLATIAHAALHAGGVRDAGRARVGPDAAPEPSHYGHRHAPLTALKKFAIIRYPYRPTATFGDYRP